LSSLHLDVVVVVVVKVDLVAVVVVVVVAVVVDVVVVVVVVVVITGHSAELHSSTSVPFPGHSSLPPNSGSLQARALNLNPWPQEAVH